MKYFSFRAWKWHEKECSLSLSGVVELRGVEVEMLLGPATRLEMISGGVGRPLPPLGTARHDGDL